MTPLRFLTPASLAVGLCLASAGAPAQTPNTAKVQLWMDLSTGPMAGMPEMDSLPGGSGMEPQGSAGGGYTGGMSGASTAGEAADANAPGNVVNPVNLLRGLFGR